MAKAAELNFARRVVTLLLTGLVGCATAGTPNKTSDDEPPASTTTSGSAAAAAAASRGGPEIVHSAKTYKLARKDAVARYAKGARCGGNDSPVTFIGEPDQKNEMQIGKELVVTYGYRYPEGTLLIRCRADHVEVARTLK